MLRCNLYGFAAAALITLVTSVPASARDEKALLDLLVDKGVINEKEAAQVEDSLQKDSHTAAERMTLSPSVTEMKIGGDMRLRYQWDQRDLQQDPWEVGAHKTRGDKDRSPAGVERSRWRMRLRLRDEFKLGDSFFGGVQIGTGQAADADNQTIQDGFSDWDIYISRAYLGWNAADWLTIVAGKQPNPLYWTELVWSTEVSPTGLSESIKLDTLWRHVAGGEQGKWNVWLNLAQFIYDDNDENAFDNDTSNDAYMFASQIVTTYTPRKDLKFTIAPGAMFYNSADLSGFVNENPFDSLPPGAGETRDLMILGLPGEANMVFHKIPTKFFWDIAWNPKGYDRLKNVFHLYDHDVQDDIAWMVGVQLGKNTVPGDFSVLASWRDVGICSVDPNINDGDFALGELNTRGIKLTAIYSLTSFSTLNLSYCHAWNLRDHLSGGEATFGAAIADVNSVDYIQFDWNMRF